MSDEQPCEQNDHAHEESHESHEPHEPQPEPSVEHNEIDHTHDLGDSASHGPATPPNSPLPEELPPDPATLAAEQDYANRLDAEHDGKEFHEEDHGAEGEGEGESPAPSAAAPTPAHTRTRKLSPEESFSYARFDVERAALSLRQSSAATQPGTWVHTAITHLDDAVARMDHSSRHHFGEKSAEDHAKARAEYERTYKDLPAGSATQDEYPDETPEQDLDSDPDPAHYQGPDSRLHADSPEVLS